MAVRRRSWRAAVLTALGAACLPAGLLAQSTPVRRDSAVAKLTTGQQIRLSTEGMARLVGRAGVAANDTLDFVQDDMVRRIPVPAIDTLWIRGRGTAHGAIIGGAVLGCFTAIIAAAWTGSCESSNCTPVPLAALGGFAMGATVGAVLGGIIGGSVPAWKRIYP